MKPKYIALAGGVAIIVGSLMPWATASAGIFSRSINGTDGDGMITLLAGVAAVLAAFVAKETPGTFGSPLAGVFGLVSGGIALNALIKISGAIADADSLISASPGTGLFVILVGALLALAGGFTKNPAGVAVNAGASTFQMQAGAQVQQPPQQASRSTADRMSDLKSMLDSKLITQEEYDLKRADLLKEI